AMTGHQENPATGSTLMGEPTYEVDLEMMVRACGVKRVFVVDPRNVEELEKVIVEEVGTREPSVIIARRDCILIKRG
ncbi:MAG: indolepyruvate ferredoxin oxidoreductase subunit alpha, partial [Spirochaetae bacterium HGW-Spirochaetae-5]